MGRLQDSVNTLPKRVCIMFKSIFNLRSLALASSLCVVVATDAANANAGPVGHGSHGYGSGYGYGHGYGYGGYSHGYGPGYGYGYGGLSRSYNSWGGRCYFPTYRCYGYYSPTQGWYYWYSPYNQYMPVSVMAQYPPVDTLATPITPAPGQVADPSSGAATQDPGNGNTPLPPLPVPNAK